MATTTRQELIDYCLRKLGAPVIDINVDPDQVEDRVDESLQFYQAYHSDAMHHHFYIHKATAADVVNKYIELPESFAYIRHVLPFSQSGSSASQLSDYWQYTAQQYQNVQYSIASSGGGLASLQQSMSYINTMTQLMTGKSRVRFSRHMDRIHIEDPMIEGDFYVVDGYQLIDPETYTDVWNDYFLKKYTTALIKRQWGANLMKYTGMQLPGGVEFNGRQMFDDAIAEIEKLEEEMRMNWEFPPDFFMG